MQAAIPNRRMELEEEPSEQPLFGFEHPAPVGESSDRILVAALLVLIAVERDAPAQP
jgi:hypothetical protein